MSEPIGMRGSAVPPAECWQERGASEIVLAGEADRPYATIEIKNSPWLRRILMTRAHILAAVREREAMAAEIERLRAALAECAAPHLLGNEAGIDWEGLAREFSRRQQVAAKAIGKPTGADLSPKPEPTP